MKIAAQIDRDDILFPRCDDIDQLADAVSRALDAPASEPRILVYVARVEYRVLGEIVPLFVDEAGHAWIELAPNSNTVRQSVLAGLRSSGDFEWI